MVSGDFYIKDKNGREANFDDVMPGETSLRGNGYYKGTKELIVV